MAVGQTQEGNKKFNLENKKLKKVKTPLTICNKIDFLKSKITLIFPLQVSIPRRLVVTKL